MPTLVVKNLPDDLHARLKARAQRNHRSVTKEMVFLIEQALHGQPAPECLPPPVALKGGPLRIKDIEEAIAADRD